MAILFVLKGADEGKRFELGDSVVTLGRDANNSCRLHDTEASRRHAELRPLPGGGYQIVDLGSSNGTFVQIEGEREFLLSREEVVLRGRGQFALGRSCANSPQVVSFVCI